ncbi:ribosome recycling factor [candidate division WWE3 bacterium]|nr:ribosome recycling factor [candidate division WWE3 bacterium]
MNKNELKTQLQKAVDALKQELTQIRTGRANTSMLDPVRVNAYESQMSLQEVGSITMPDATTIVITPWDKSLIENIAKAIRESDVQVEPVVEGDRVRLSFPGLTEERRKEFAKIVSAKVEESRQQIRRIRQEAMKDIDKLFADKEIGEDEKFKLREDVEEVVKEYNDKLEDLGEKKTKEIMTV